MSVNRVILVGRVGKDPEVKYLDGGTCVANISLATSEKYKDKNGNQVENTEWHNLVLWKKIAEIAEKYVKKGTLIYIEGKLKTRNWEDQNGQKKYATDIQVEKMQLLSSKSDQNESQPTNNESFDDLPDDTDLPF